MSWKFKIFLGDSEIGGWDPSEKTPIQFGFHYGGDKVIPLEWLDKWEDKHQDSFHHNIQQVIKDWEKENE